MKLRRVLRMAGIVAIILPAAGAAVQFPTHGQTLALGAGSPGYSTSGGVPGNVAAAELNALAARNTAHTRAPLTTVKFILNWLPNVEFSGLWMAEAFHWWEKAGIHMTYEGWSPSVHPETDVPAAGGNTFGFQSGAAIVIARSQGVPIEAVYTDTQRSVFGLTVLANSGIHSLKQLAGKRVGYQPHEFYVPATMLACAGLKQTQWRPVPVGFDIVQLTAHHVDAYLTFVTNEPIALAMNGVKTHTFPAANYCFHFYDDVMFTTTSLIAKNPSLVAKVTRLVAAGFQWAHSHPTKAARITVSRWFPASTAGTDIFGKPTTANENTVQQIRELKAFTPFSRAVNGKFTGLMTAKTWQDSINILYRYGQIKTKPAVSSLFTNQFNPYR